MSNEDIVADINDRARMQGWPLTDSDAPDFLDGARLEYRECMEVRRLLGYLWVATGYRTDALRPCDLFAEDDPIVADVQKLAIFLEEPRETGEEE